MNKDSIHDITAGILVLILISIIIIQSYQIGKFMSGWDSYYTSDRARFQQHIIDSLSREIEVKQIIKKK